MTDLQLADRLRVIARDLRDAVIAADRRHCDLVVAAVVAKDRLADLANDCERRFINDAAGALPSIQLCKTGRFAPGETP